MEREPRDFLVCNKTRSFSGPPTYSQSKYTWKAISVPSAQHRKVNHLSLTTLHLDMIETTWEQVDITALSYGSYLWLKNIAKIRISIHTLMLENEIVGREQKSPPISVPFLRIKPQNALGDTQNWWQNSSDLLSPLCKWVMTQKTTNSQRTGEQLTIWPSKIIKVNKSGL